VVLLLLATLTSCGQPPRLPADDSASARALTGSDGQEYLRDITSHDWDDGGRAAGATLSWIGRDANSPDQAAAQRAGEAANSVSTYLADNSDTLRDTSNSELAVAFATALTPFQGALAGDVRSVHGFETGGNLGSGDFSRSRNVFAAIDADGPAGTRFNDAAAQKVHAYLRTWAPAAGDTRSPDAVALDYGARLAGLIAGGQRTSGADEDTIRRSQYWINWAGYEFARASGARLGDPVLGPQYFSRPDVLKAPDQMSAAELSPFSTALLNYATRNGQGSLGGNVDRSFDEGAGT
jgi:hypothetical protein